jgi:hypothetical protein
MTTANHDSDIPFISQNLFYWATLSTCTSIIALTSIALLARLQLTNSNTSDIFIVACVGFFLLATPTLLSTSPPLYSAGKKLHIAEATLYTLLFTLLLGWLLGPIVKFFIAILGIAALTLISKRLVQSNLSLVLSAAFSGLLIGFTLAGLCWGSNYLSPNFAEGLKRGHGNLDEIFHIAIANMIKSYGVPSTGLNGLIYLPYHWGSHCYLASFSKLLGISVLESYNLLYPIVITPLFVYSMLVCGISLAERPTVNHPLLCSLCLPLVPISTIGGILPDSLAQRIGLWNSSVISESMCFSLIFALCGISYLLHTIKRLSKSNQQQTQHLSSIEYVKLAICVFLITLTKISVGYISTSIISVIVLLYPTSASIVRRIAAASFILCFFFVAFIITRYPGEAGHIEPFHFVYEYVHPPLRKLFLPLILAWSFVASCGYLLMIAKTPLSWRNFLGFEFSPELFCLIITILSSFFPAILMKISGGSAFYFFDVQRQVACLLIIAGIVRVTNPMAQPGRRDAEPRLRARGLSIHFGKCLILLLSFFILSNSSLNTLSHLRTLESNVSANYGWIGFRGFTIFFRNLTNPPVVSDNKSTNNRTEMIELLEQIALTKPVEKTYTVAYVPRRNTIYWNFFEAEMRKATPLLLPAVAEVAMLEGVPDLASEPNFWAGYGFDLYKSQSSQYLSSSTAMPPVEWIIALARSKGFKSLLIIDQINEKLSLRYFKIPIEDS